MNHRLTALILYAAAIFIVSSIPGTDLGEPPAPDYVMHFLEFAGLGFLCANYLASRRPGNGAMTALLLTAILLSSAYGALDEIHQYFIPSRCCDIRDWVADTLGATAGAVVWGLMATRVESRFLGRMPS